MFIKYMSNNILDIKKYHRSYSFFLLINQLKDRR